MEEVYARFIRSANEETLSELVEKMKKVSRITNAIYLQQGLIDGTIPSDDLLTDILKLKLMKLSDVVDMDSTKMKAGVDSLKALAQSIKPTDAMKENLKYFLALNEIHDAVGVETVGGEWPKADNIKEIVEKFKDKEIAFSVVDKLMEYMETLNTQVITLTRNFEFQNVVHLSDIENAFLKVVQSGTSLIDEANSLSKEHADYTTITNIGNVFSSLAVVLHKVKAVQKCEENSGLLGLNLEAKAANYESFEKIDNFSKDGQKVQMTLVSELSRQSNSAGSSQYSFPFMDSGNNIFGLSDALKDPWIKSVIKADSFPESLKQISSIGELLRKINDGLAVKDKISLELQKLFEMIDLVSSVVYNSKEAENIAEALTKCEPLISRNKLQLDDITELLKQSREFDNAKKDMKRALIEFIDSSKSQEFQKVLSEVIEISRKCTSRDASVVEPVLKDYQQYADLKKFTNDVSQLKGHADKIKKWKSPLQVSASKVHSYADKVNSFKADYDSFFSKGFDCLAKVKNTEPLVKMVILAQHAGSLTTMTTGFNEIDKFIDKISKVVSEIKKVKTGMDGMKGKNTPASDALNMLQNREIHSKTIGSATQGIVNMATVLEKKTDFEGLITELSLVQQESQKVLLDQKDLENLDKLVTIGSDLSTMYQTLETWKSSLKDPKSATLADYFPIFSDAKAVSEITLDFHETAMSLQTLVDMVTDPGDKDKLMTVQKLVREMNSVGMKFSDHSKAFDNSKTTLSDLDTFFVNYGSSWRSLETSTLPVAVAKTSLLSKNFMIGFYCGEFIFVCLSIFGHVYFWRYIRKLKLMHKLEKRKDYDKNLNKKARMRVNAQAAPKKKNSGNRDEQTVNERELDKTQSLLSESTSTISQKYAKTATKELILKLTKTQIADENKSIKRDEKTKTDGTISEKQNKSTRSGDCYTYFWDFVKWSMKTACIEEKSEKGAKSSKKEEDITFKFLNDRLMIISSSPVNESESEKFWTTVKKRKVRDIAMLSANVGMEIATEKIETFCYQYFPNESDGSTVTFGDFKIKCVNKEEDFRGLLVKRTLQVSYKEGESAERQFKVNHYQYNWNPNSRTPLSPSIMVKLLQKLRKIKTPILLHGKNEDKGPSEALIFMELFLQRIKTRRGKIEYHDLLGEMRKVVPGALNNCFIFGFSIIASFVFVYGENNTCEFIRKLLVEYILGANYQQRERNKRTKKVKKLRTDAHIWERKDLENVQLKRNELVKLQPPDVPVFVMVDMLGQESLWDDDDKDEKKKDAETESIIQ